MLRGCCGDARMSWRRTRNGCAYGHHEQVRVRLTHRANSRQFDGLIPLCPCVARTVSSTLRGLTTREIYALAPIYHPTC